MSSKFVMFPKMWQTCLAEQHADGSTYRVALYLLDRASFSEHVPLIEHVARSASGTPTRLFLDRLLQAYIDSMTY